MELDPSPVPLERAEVMRQQPTWQGRRALALGYQSPPPNSRPSSTCSPMPSRVGARAAPQPANWSRIPPVQTSTSVRLSRAVVMQLSPDVSSGQPQRVGTAPHLPCRLRRRIIGHWQTNAIGMAPGGLSKPRGSSTIPPHGSSVGLRKGPPCRPSSSRFASRSSSPFA